MSTLTPGLDILDLLADDHHEAETLLNRFESVPQNQRDEYFCQVVHDLVRHEVAEELVVYPALRADASGGDREADARIHEQSEAEQMLAEMENLDAESAEFQAKFVSLRAAVVRHAKAEESGAFTMLRQSEDTQARTKLGARYESAKASAPTHPHPHSPDTPPGNRVLGPVAAFADKLRDAIKGT
jgi:hemerythrin superfamily protein